MSNTGLVLEGGGSRGVFTAGVLKELMERNMYFPYVIGVSAGACNGSSYISKQKDRNRSVHMDFLDNPEYLSFRNYVKKRELFGMDFLFDKLPNELMPYDFDTYRKAEENLVIGTTDCMTGEAIYYDRVERPSDLYTVLRASSSLPFVAPVVPYQQRILMDGGIADPIPIKKSIEDGHTKNIVILTQNRDYVKKPQSHGWLLRRKYRQYPGLIRAVEQRHRIYNETLQFIRDEEKKGHLFVISPSEKLDVGRVERSKAKLEALYEKGQAEMQKQMEALEEFVQSN
ncbi:patatin-like phospholipase family protein [Alkalihalobacillus pseudalcaliphilus]|uniref:patatin-like phospholipase family protein n=1 Tax=Alkalihalobacillus pseudalcaliphilus TaxID=79884 RepID=UPI00064DAD39|nr:patatin family protein [Alkalihalobacillus pseudalcaliphilus]KMK74620.1 patatin [Alkalihalobacillus pseudalcaliphilus]